MRCPRQCEGAPNDRDEAAAQAGDAVQVGLRTGSAVTSITGAAVAVTLLVLVVACFLAPPAVPAVGAASVAPPSITTLLAFVPALRAVFDGVNGARMVSANVAA